MAANCVGFHYPKLLEKTDTPISQFLYCWLVELDLTTRVCWSESGAPKARVSHYTWLAVAISSGFWKHLVFIHPTHRDPCNAAGSREWMGMVGFVFLLNLFLHGFIIIHPSGTCWRVPVCCVPRNFGGFYPPVRNAEKYIGPRAHLTPQLRGLLALRTSHVQAPIDQDFAFLLTFFKKNNCCFISGLFL